MSDTYFEFLYYGHGLKSTANHVKTLRMEDELFSSQPIDLIPGARILSPDFNSALRYDIHIADGKFKDFRSNDSDYAIDINTEEIDANGYLVAPSLCHAHVHLDKCFLLSDLKYSDLEIIKGDFTEAMALTGKAKQRFERDDLLRRGKWLIAESIAAGVTHMRAFAEVDHVVGFKCLDAGIELKKMYAGACEIQVCAFAQEPLFSGENGDKNRGLMKQAIMRKEVDVIGSTPYVENGEENLKKNIYWAVDTAYRLSKHLDLHLDYHLNPQQPSSTGFVLRCLQEVEWYQKKYPADMKRIALGHCTRLTQFTSKEWQHTASIFSNTPTHFVGLPTSDLFIQGKPDPDSGGGERLRGTLQIPQMIKDYNIPGCIAINNVGNAFTPYGSCDPLSIASMGIGIYHAGTKGDVQILYECISARAKEAIGFPGEGIQVGGRADFVMFDVRAKGEERGSRQRGRGSLQEVVWDPPSVERRKTVFGGRVITA